MIIHSPKTEYQNELDDLIRLFFPPKNIQPDEEYFIQFEQKEHIFRCKIGLNEKTIYYNDFETNGKPILKKNEKAWMKECVYLFLSSKWKKTLPWGCLTGVRPTKLAYDLLAEGIASFVLSDEMKQRYYLADDKARLLNDILQTQGKTIKNDSDIDFYVNIPICPSRCSYCSFISSQAKDVENLIPKYIETLLAEIQFAKKIIAAKPYIVRNVYVGGGTPTVLSAGQLDVLLAEIRFSAGEFCVECGRPDTIDREKLEVMKKHGVTRICINPQTFQDKTLKKIGRSHTVADVVKAYLMALEMGFTVNMDFIAGLPGETISDFKRTIDIAMEFSPHNITIHTLALKKGSELIEESMDWTKEKTAQKMMNYAIEKIYANGYFPYYLYRLKNTISALENIGFCKKDMQCRFNINSMEEFSSVMACGANAISKRVFHRENRIERAANVKFLREYIERIPEMLERKQLLFS